MLSMSPPQTDSTPTWSTENEKKMEEKMEGGPFSPPFHSSQEWSS